MSERDADLEQELIADYRVMELEGDHYEVGYQMGAATTLREVESWRGRESELAFAQACADEVGRLHPPLLDEYRGYAAAQGRRWEEVLAHFSLNLPEGTLSGCTTFVWRQAHSRHTMAGRNYDFLYGQRQRYLRRLSPAGYAASLGTQAGLLGSCYDGVNNHGLFVALHLIHAETPEEVPPGVPYHLIPRIVLERCRTAREAVEQIVEMPHLFPFNYLVADAEEMFAVEAYPGRVRVRPPVGDVLIVTNYFQLPEMRALHGRRSLKAQIERVRWLEKRIAEEGGTDPEEAWAWMQGVLRDHGVPVCNHRPTQATLWAVVADVTERRIGYCLGAPCRNGFVEYGWPC
jgi:predicted choloylglycine hydrolase